MGVLPKRRWLRVIPPLFLLCIGKNLEVHYSVGHDDLMEFLLAPTVRLSQGSQTCNCVPAGTVLMIRSLQEELGDVVFDTSVNPGALLKGVCKRKHHRRSEFLGG
jgi:hypothetical protein